MFGMSCEKRGGIESFLLNMSKNMDSNCIFDYVVIGNNSIHETSVHENNGEIFYLTPYSINPLKHLVELIKLLKTEIKTHPVAYFNLFSMVHMIPILLCKLFGYKIILHSHNSDIPNKSALYRFFHQIGRKTMPELKNVVLLTCAPRAAEFMFGEKNLSKTTMIFNAIDTKKFMFTSEQRDKIRSKLAVKDEKIVGFVGRLEKQKNPLFLLRIYEALHKEDKNTKLLVIGSGYLEAEMRKFVKQKRLGENVIFLPAQSNIYDYYCAMDILLLPSLFEGLPVVLEEAQAAGLPSLTSSEATPEIARIHEDFVYFLSLNDPIEKWVTLIADILSKQFDRKKWNMIVQKSSFNLATEAKKLEGILMS